MITPTFNRLPKIYQEYGDPVWRSLTDVLDTLVEDLDQGARDICKVLDPAAIPAIFLAELSWLLAADVQPGGSDATARRKVYTAVQRHKTRGTRTQSVKPMIDAITGYSASIFISSDSDDFILLANKAGDPVDKNWATLQSNDGVNPDLGCWLVQLDSPVSYVVAGYISIDLHPTIHTATLTSVA